MANTKQINADEFDKALNLLRWADTALTGDPTPGDVQQAAAAMRQALATLEAL